MRKPLSSLALLFATTALASPGTDTFSGEDLKIETGDYFSGNVSGTETGAKYEFTKIFGWWGACYMKAEDGAFITVTEPAGRLRSISRDGGVENSHFTVYCSSSPITKDNASQAEFIGTLDAAQTFSPTGDYAYVALESSVPEAYFNSLSFTWDDPAQGGEEGPDHITAANLQSQNPEGNFSATKYDDHDAMNPSIRYTGGSGAVYDFVELISDGTWWTLDWNYPSPAGHMVTSTSGGYLKSVKFEMDWVPEYISFYVSPDPLTQENKNDATQITLYRENGIIPEWTADGIYRYLLFSTAQERITDLAIEWTEESPVVEAKTPSIKCYDNPVTAGSQVYISTETQDATLHVDVYLNGEKHIGEEDQPTSATHEGSSYSFRLPGKSGDTVLVEASATKEGFAVSKTASQEFSLQMPLAERPGCDTYLSKVLPGQTITISSSTENATISYKYGIINHDNESDNWTSEQLNGPSPVSITVPATAQKGMVFFVEATATAEGFAESSLYELYTPVASAKLDPPSFSIETGREVRPGTKVAITRPDDAKAIHYSVNGGEAKTSEEFQVEIAITEDTAIEAWVSGEPPYVDSDKATATYTVEVLSPRQDAITPEMFTDDTSNDKYAEYAMKSQTTGYEYVYNGGMWTKNDAICFYLDRKSPEGMQSILYNKEGRKITRVKLESTYDWSGCYIMFSKEPITQVTETMQGFDWMEGRLRIMNDDDRADFGFGEWIDLSTLEEDFQDCSYFAVWRFSQNSYVSRIIIEYADKEDGIDGINAENCGTEAIYDLNGTRMQSVSGLRPGIYIRVTGSKTEKIIVK